MKRPREQTGAVSFLERIAEQRILEAQRAGAFDNLPGKGKPLELEDLSWVPEDLRIGYHVLKNAHVSVQGMDALSQHCRCLLLEHRAPRKVVLFGLFRPRANLMLGFQNRRVCQPFP